jgi:hypothetical protein
MQHLIGRVDELILEQFVISTYAPQTPLIILDDMKNMFPAFIVLSMTQTHY